jgi:pyruvate formate lyase activating enzyme
MGLVLGVEKVVSRDGPGTRTVILFKGCRLRCQWCYSPEGQRKQREVVFHAERCDGCGICLDKCSCRAVVLDASGPRLDRKRCHSCGLCVDCCPTGALKMVGQWLTVEQLVQRVEADRPEYGSDGGMTLSGGDVTLQPAFAADLLRACRERGVHTTLETPGYAPWDVLRPLVELSDLVLFDVKHSDPALHRRYLGVDNTLILDNLAKTVALGASVQARAPLIPGYTDDDANVGRTADLVATLGVRRIAFVPFRPDSRQHYAPLERVYWHDHARPQTPERLEEIRQLATRHGLEVEIVDWGASAQPERELVMA